MASWTKIEPENTEKMMVGRTYLHELGRSGPNVIKLFLPYFTNFCNNIECFSKSLQLNLKFVGKARSLPYSGAPGGFSNRVGSCFTNRY
jgi:hypothetical protein